MQRIHPFACKCVITVLPQQPRLGSLHGELDQLGVQSVLLEEYQESMLRLDPGK